MPENAERALSRAHAGLRGQTKQESVRAGKRGRKSEINDSDESDEDWEENIRSQKRVCAHSRSKSWGPRQGPRPPERMGNQESIRRSSRLQRRFRSPISHSLPTPCAGGSPATHCNRDLFSRTTSPTLEQCTEPDTLPVMPDFDPCLITPDSRLVRSPSKEAARAVATGSRETGAQEMLAVVV